MRDASAPDSNPTAPSNEITTEKGSSPEKKSLVSYTLCSGTGIFVAWATGSSSTAAATTSVCATILPPTIDALSNYFYPKK